MAMNSQPRMVPAMSFKGQQISKKAMMMFLNQRGCHLRILCMQSRAWQGLCPLWNHKKG